MDSSRLKGHTLPNEGRMPGWPPSHQNRAGSVRCSCGEASPTLPSTRARRQWHREHKDAIRSGQS